MLLQASQYHSSLLSGTKARNTNTSVICDIRLVENHVAVLNKELPILPTIESETLEQMAQNIVPLSISHKRDIMSLLNPTTA